MKAELNQLQIKADLLTTAIPSSEKLTEDLDFLNKLIPNIEDYFSIVYALESLSQKSNFIVTSYNVSVDKSTSEKLRLNVTGTGDSQTFIEFLKNYNYGGGRLITSDKILIDPNYFGAIKIDLTFYSKNVPVTQNLDLKVDGKVFTDLETLKSKVNFTFGNNEASSTPVLDYPKKESPF